MQTELNALENKLGHLVNLIRHLRADNHRLRQELATAQSQGRQANDKIESAKQRIERLLSQLPEEET